uniref:eukaryotic translation initiation factor 3 subunit G-like n=1 Tax=Erigeron canadensis TaxID=72917 RepID=UPI001CB9938F|nr:eukaryotic translation initiation factor 3 subunit G-like [Erigeron canadensis]
MAIETLPTAPPPQKPRWGELEEEDDGTDYDFLLPPKQIIGPDEHGIKKVVEYKFNDEGNRVKTTTTTRVRKLANARLSKRAVERRSWSKFGDAVHEDVGARLTMVSTEEIILERPKAAGSKTEDTNASGDPLAKSGAVLMVCRTCGKKGEHWTSKCPYKDLAQPSETFVENPSSADSAPPGASGPTKGAYVPPTLRPGAARTTAGSDMRRRNDENSVRVNNLSEDTREPDLMELFRPFGSISRVYVAMDQKTGTSRGFGFVNFVRREEGERAIAKLNGYGYDNLILNVEWAAPRAN